MNSACSVSEGPTEISSVVKEFPSLVPLFKSHDQSLSSRGENILSVLDERRADVSSFEEKEAAGHDTNSNPTRVPASARAVPANVLTFAVTLVRNFDAPAASDSSATCRQSTVALRYVTAAHLIHLNPLLSCAQANVSHFEDFVRATTKRFGGALSVENGFRSRAGGDWPPPNVLPRDTAVPVLSEGIRADSSSRSMPATDDDDGSDALVQDRTVQETTDHGLDGSTDSPSPGEQADAGADAGAGVGASNLDKKTVTLSPEPAAVKLSPEPVATDDAAIGGRSAVSDPNKDAQNDHDAKSVESEGHVHQGDAHLNNASDEFDALRSPTQRNALNVLAKGSSAKLLMKANSNVRASGCLSRINFRCFCFLFCFGQ